MKARRALSSWRRAFCGRLAVRSLGQLIQKTREGSCQARGEASSATKDISHTVLLGVIIEQA